MTSFLIVDAQSVKNTDSAERKGYDADKKVSDIKRHIVSARASPFFRRSFLVIDYRHERSIIRSARRRTRSEVSALSESFVRSGLSLREYSRLHGVAKCSLSAVVNRRHRVAQPVTPAQPSFVPVEIVAAQKHEPRSSARLVLEFSSGLRLAVEQDFDEPTLRRLVAVLV
jgi:hypothetical protein